MTLRFWRRVRIVPGLRVNLSKSGASVSVGRRGAWLTSGPRGQRVTVGATGTGLFWTQRLRRPVAASVAVASRAWRCIKAACFVGPSMPSLALLAAFPCPCEPSLL
jgi:hypothetical protein